MFDLRTGRPVYLNGIGFDPNCRICKGTGHEVIGGPGQEVWVEQSCRCAHEPHGTYSASTESE